MIESILSIRSLSDFDSLKHQITVLVSHSDVDFLFDEIVVHLNDNGNLFDVDDKIPSFKIPVIFASAESADKYFSKRFVDGTDSNKLLWFLQLLQHEVPFLSQDIEEFLRRACS